MNAQIEGPLSAKPENLLILSFTGFDPYSDIRGRRRARRCEGPAMPQFGDSGDKIGQAVAVARYILQEGSFSATPGRSLDRR